MRVVKRRLERELRTSVESHDSYSMVLGFSFRHHAFRPQRPALAKAFGDHMVLQRDQPVNLWGWADPGNEVTLSFAAKPNTPRQPPTADGASPSTSSP